jgi:hypothetical protein
MPACLAASNGAVGAVSFSVASSLYYRNMAEDIMSRDSTGFQARCADLTDESQTQMNTVDRGWLRRLNSQTKDRCKGGRVRTQRSDQ